jgi:nucleoid-associated protein YejK
MAHNGGMTRYVKLGKSPRMEMLSVEHHVNENERTQEILVYSREFNARPSLRKKQREANKDKVLGQCADQLIKLSQVG